jgi:hypothetical protein
LDIVTDFTQPIRYSRRRPHLNNPFIEDRGGVRIGSVQDVNDDGVDGSMDNISNHNLLSS